ncbi:Nuclear transcription factor Y subunit C-1 [Hondaea fermentalgiana]|uniref:Nuclear transcription factor Y subunit C-1 n=1 Tax=Hondaea fermentalgiana TaxID=2315210 RepID=A0A2R5GY58_9STRA|nr:Nuclear transcription factor Y subunit C-1 [Hondaea fermentalgiana]|eukprot:GBG33381.1 Nuclear transcription factor Y subunit C-1 [Hondaea fermentalgiana]
MEAGRATGPKSKVPAASAATAATAAMPASAATAASAKASAGKKEAGKGNARQDKAKEKNGVSESAGGQKRSRHVLLDGGEELIRAGTIRRIMKVPNEVKMTGSEAVHLVCKSTELFIGDLLDRAMEKALKDNRKVVRYQDLADCVRESPNLDPFVELLPDLATLCNPSNVN